MRTVIFFGLLIIADAIGKQTGWSLPEKSITLAAVIFVFAIAADIVDVVHSLR